MKFTFAGLALLSFLFYLPAFLTEFGLCNDYRYLRSNPISDGYVFPESLHLLAMGRPVGAWLINVQGLFLGTLGTFVYGRLITFAVTMGSAWLVFRYLARRLRVEPVLAGAMVFCIVLLPGSQLFILWLTNFAPGALNILIGLSCYLVLDKIDPLEFTHGQKRSLFLALAAFGIFFVSLCIYPPTALTFLVLTIARMLLTPADEWPLVRLQVVRDLLFAAMGMVLYFLVIKFIMLPWLSVHGPEAFRETVASINQQGTYRFEIGANLGEKLSLFGYLSSIAFGGALHAIMGAPSSWIMGGLISFGFAFVGYRAWGLPRASVFRGWVPQKAAFGFLIILFACAPSLLAEKGEVGYRVVTSYEMIAVLCLFAPLHWLGAMSTAFPSRSIAMTLALITGGLGGWNISDVTRNENRQLMFIKGKLESANKSQLNTVIGILRPRGYSFIERPLLLEFAKPIDHVSSFAGAVEGLLPETGLGNRQLSISYAGVGRTFTFQPYEATDPGLPPIKIESQGDGLMIVDEQSLLIDLNNASVREPRSFGQIPAVSTSNGVGGRVLFALRSAELWREGPYSPLFYPLGQKPANLDDNESGFSSAESWQPGPAPQWVELRLPGRLVFRQVTFYAGPDALKAGDMPRDWSVVVSDDGVNWVAIDARSGQDKWKAGEKRTYRFEHLANAGRYRFVFTAGNGPVLHLFRIGLSQE